MQKNWSQPKNFTWFYISKLFWQEEYTAKHVVCRVQSCSMQALYVYFYITTKPTEFSVYVLSTITKYHGQVWYCHPFQWHIYHGPCACPSLRKWIFLMVHNLYVEPNQASSSANNVTIFEKKHQKCTPACKMHPEYLCSKNYQHKYAVSERKI